MAEKGYNGHFQSTFGFNDKLFDNLVQYVLEGYEQLQNIGPFHLTTYSKWTNDEQPYVRCSFATDFLENKGVLRSKEIPILKNSDIPTSAEDNRMIIQRKSGLKI